MKFMPAIFEEREIRRLYDEKTETWFFSVVDIIQVLTQQPDYQTSRKYWNKLKERLSKEGSQSVTNCHRLKLPAADGKSYLTDVASAEGGKGDRLLNPKPSCQSRCLTPRTHLSFRPYHAADDSGLCFAIRPN